jgi:hypothetical protein
VSPERVTGRTLTTFGWLEFYGKPGAVQNRDFIANMLYQFEKKMVPRAGIEPATRGFSTLPGRFEFIG